MFLTIEHVLSEAELADVQAALKTVRWTDGTKTAGREARSVKQNLQADLSSRTGAKLRDRLIEAVRAHPVLDAAAQPAKFSTPIVSRTEEGGGYGLHYDNPFMAQSGGPLRTDLSFTLFLSDPDSYEGGALIIERPGETKRFKPSAGSLILYPTSSLHRVEPVTSGQRLACVGWIESRVRSAAQREILFDLQNLQADLRARDQDLSAARLTLGKVIANLKREFS